MSDDSNEMGYKLPQEITNKISEYAVNGYVLFLINENGEMCVCRNVETLANFYAITSFIHKWGQVQNDMLQDEISSSEFEDSEDQENS